MTGKSDRFLPGASPSKRVGFGTSGLMGAAATNGGRLRLLNLAYDLGVRHFDTAPLYGMGEAEEVLGRFVRGKRDSITLATKYGLFPPAIPAYYRWAVPLARGLYHRSRLLKRALSRLVATLDGVRKAPLSQGQVAVTPHRRSASAYDTMAMESMLDRSLSRLHTDYIDCYLLHECAESQVNDAVVDTLTRFISKGKIRSFGVATGHTAAKAILEQHPDQIWITQLEHTVFHPDLDIANIKNNGGIITHGALNRVFRRLQHHLADSATEQRWSGALNYDMSEPNSIPAFLLAHALLANESGIVLFSSRSAKNIQRNLEGINNLPICSGQVAIFVRLIRAELHNQA